MLGMKYRVVIKQGLAQFLAIVAAPVIELAAWLVARLPIQSVGAKIARRHGVHILRKHYYSPIPVDEDFGPGFWDSESTMVGVDMGEERALALMRDVFPRYLREFRRNFPIDKPTNDEGFYLINSVYMAVDAHVYYSLIRHLKPRQIIEIGSGQSTLLATAAAETNRSLDSAPCTVTAIEPFPPAFLETRSQNSLKLIRKKLQEVDADLFQRLEKNDILFIDSSHVLREGSDVQLEYLEILPRLNPGVLVHVHDISLPRRYPKIYFDQNLFWNEQYLLQAYLIHNSHMEVIWPGNHMMLRHPAAMEALFEEISIMRQRFPYSEPTAFWMRVKVR